MQLVKFFLAVAIGIFTAAAVESARADQGVLEAGVALATPASALD